MISDRPPLKPLEPDDLGGTAGDEREVLIPVTETVGWVRRILAWFGVAGYRKPVTHPPSWLEQQQQENAAKADAAVVDACNETEEQRRIRGL